MQQTLVFTDSAISRIKHLIIKEENDQLMLRVFITGGGCSGFQYGFTFEEVISDGDIIIEKDGVKALIDPMSIHYLMDTEVDFQETLESAQFVIRNPNAKTTCGCGSSFAI